MHVLVLRAPTPEDAAPPVPRRFDVPDAITVLDLLARVRDAGVVPDLAGTRATWVAEGERPLAVVTQEYRDPWPLLHKEARFVEVAGRLPRPHLFLDYRGRPNPEDVYRSLGGDPVRLGCDAFKASQGISWPAALRDFFR